MNRKSLITIILVLSGIFLIAKLFINFLEWKTYKSSVSGNIENIKTQFRGLVIDKYSYRKDAPDTHLKIKTIDSVIEILPFGEVVEKSNIGDSIIKFKSENVIIIKRHDSLILEHYYVRIPKRNRKDSKFPVEWKNKWMESSAYDTLK